MLNTKISRAALETSRASPPLSRWRSSLRKLAPYNTSEHLENLADRRSSRAVARLCAGIFILYQRSTGAKESDPFSRDGESWAAFEQAALPEMASFAFYHREKKVPRTPNSVLADSMGHIWLTAELPTLTTIQLITELANHISSTYEITPIDRRTRKRASLGLNVIA